MHSFTPGRGLLVMLAMLAMLALAAFALPANAQTAEEFFSDQALHEIRLVMLTMDPADWEKLLSSQDEDTQYRCELRWRDVVVSNVGIRVRGRAEGSDTQPTFRLDVDARVPEQTFLGLTSFVLDRLRQDVSASRLGSPPPREARVQMYVNDEYVADYVLVETGGAGSVDRVAAGGMFGSKRKKRGTTPPPPPPPAPPAPDIPPEPPAPPEDVVDVVLVGAGDIAWCGVPGAAETAKLLDAIPGTVFTSGDNVYMSGTAKEFQDCYEPTWGRHKGRTRPSPGNHDYGVPGGRSYFEYFGANAGPPGLGYYSYSLGAWHIVSLNSVLSAGDAAAQLRWLRDDLAAHPTRCAAAYFHHPLVSSGQNGDNLYMQNVWRLLYEFGVDVVLAGHDHSYERFAPMDADLRASPSRGIRQFIVGTGGASPYQFPGVKPNSEVRGSVWGVLKLTLGPDSYTWEFVPVAGASFRDAGTEACR